MVKERKLYEGGSLIDIASIALNRLKTLSESGKISDKLIAFSLVLFILILGLDISYWLGSMSGINPNEPFLFIVLFAVSMIFSTIGSLAYGPLLEIISNLSNNKIQPLRIGVMILFTDLSIAIIGTLFWIQLLINASAIIIGAQLITILTVGFLGFPEPPEDKTVKPAQLREILGDLASIITIVNFIIWLGTIAVRFI
ncbi:hypothetical protein C5S30_04985 [ANME-1 cluster archaeon GoMg4]|nr:hypothetical protein [ANME-1 cluster archaeon GoMg4]